MALNISAAQYATVSEFASAGDYLGGWNYLASIGDNYADNAYVVTARNSTNIVDLAFEALVRAHWINTVGEDVYCSSAFDDVARQHFRQYVRDIHDNGYTLPSSRQIEQSYRDAVTDAGFPPELAFDGIVTKSIGDLFDKLWPGPKEDGIDWTDFLDMEAERQVASDVFDDLDGDEAWDKLLDDIVDTLKELTGDDPWSGTCVGNPLSQSISDLFTASSRFTAPRRDPLTLDLDGDGLETSGLSATNPILFDHDGDGVRNGTGWVRPDDGFLALDRNGNGLIDSGRELFGDATIKSDGTRAADGFAALADLDSNADGKISSLDAQFASLRVWRDLNQDGISQSGELFTLDALGIAAIDVAKTANNQTLANGNQIADLGTYTRSDGSVGTTGAVAGNLADVNLAGDTFHRQFTDTLDTSAVATLPDMQGSGAVRDLREAASLSPALAATLQGLADAGVQTRAQLLASLDTVIDQWAASSDFTPSLAAAQAKGYTLHYRLPGMEDHFGSGELLSAGEAAALQARIARVARLEHLIDVLETFNGSTFVSVQDLGVVRGNGQVVNTRTETDPALGLVSTHLYLQLADQQATLLEQSYDALKQSLYDGLVLQTRLKPYLDAVSLNIDATGIHADFSALDSRLAAEYLADKPQAFVDRFELIQYAGQGLRAMGWSGEQTLAQWIAQAEADGDWATIRAAMGSHFTATPTTGNDIFMGTSAGESLDGQGGNDHLLGAGGKDSLWGSDGDDILDGGTGDDKLYGGSGSDVYAFGRGSGFDWIASDSAANAAGDAIHLAAGITAGDVELRRYGNNLDVILKRADGGDPGIHSAGNTTERIVVEGYFSGSKINRIDFADGSVWNQAAIEARFIHYGLAGNDALAVASTLTNRVRALAGDDSVFGSTGNDMLKAMALEPTMTRCWEKQQAAYVSAGFRTATLETLAHEAGHYGRPHRLQQGAAR